jgi:hypothetical protein
MPTGNLTARTLLTLDTGMDGGSGGDSKKTKGGSKMGRYEITKRGKFWAVLDKGELVAVVVYKKGAVEIVRRLVG